MKNILRDKNIGIIIKTKPLVISGMSLMLYRVQKGWGTSRRTWQQGMAVQKLVQTPRTWRLQISVTWNKILDAVVMASHCPGNNAKPTRLREQ